ncbi:DUF3307 domain-containing protein [Actinoplanes sp. NPDC051859]|uniref:DUF3307 domain-containing protein n=1 Tax=Actinoplanes sp. NPDC051859 TaxID=3363909 RepID=UPI00379B4B17
MSNSALVFAVASATLVAAHQLADHIFQTDADAAAKTYVGWHGWRHLLIHVGTYHATALVMLVVTAVVLDVPLTFTGVVAGFGFSAVTHAILDRRWPVRWILQHLGAAQFADRMSPICGMYLADQALHYGCLWVAALLIAAF